MGEREPRAARDGAGTYDRYVSQGDAGADRGGLREEVSAAASGGTRRSAGYEKYVAPQGYSDQYDHFKNFFASVRSRKPVVEDAVFGYRAAGAALLSNLSIERKHMVHWDPDAMKVLSSRARVAE